MKYGRSESAPPTHRGVMHHQAEREFLSLS